MGTESLDDQHQIWKNLCLKGGGKEGGAVHSRELPGAFGVIEIYLNLMGAIPITIMFCIFVLCLN